MATKIVTKNSSTASAVPTASDLVQGELAVNVADKRLFTEDNGGSIVELGTNPSTIDINAGTIDGAVIGGTTPAAITGSTVTSTGNIVVTGTVDGRDVAADGTKLDGVEASADVTDTTNVTAAGALMDSEVTNLAQVKAFDSADYATAAQGTTADAALPKAGGAMTGAITTNSTFDGRDVATDGTKLDGIEVGATADQTAAEIKTAYESNADTNAFTDADNTKLAGIEAGADVTDTANVTAAGAVMDSELTSEASVKALDQGVATTDSPAFAGLTVDTTTLAVDSTNNRVGIGTASPTQALTVSGNIQIQDNDGYLQFKDTNGGTNNKFRRIYNSEQTLYISRRNDDESLEANDVVINSSGNVGIGTSSPNEALHLYNATTNVLANFESGDSKAFISFKDNSTTNTDTVFLGADGNNMAFYAGSASSERMRIDSSGQVGIGTSSPSAPLHVNGASGELMRLSVTPNSGSQQTFGLGFATGANTHPAASINALEFDASDSRASLLFSTRGVNSDSAATERVRIDTSGNLLVGQTAQNYNVAGASIGGDGLIRSARVGQVTAFNRKGSHGIISVYYKDGVTVGTISTNANSLPSDRNFKRNIQDLTLGLDFVESLNPVTYNFKIDDEGQAVMTGLIAQEVEEALTAAGVEKNSMTLLQHTPTDDVKESDYQMDYLKFVPILINSIKEQQTLIESLTARIAALEE